MSDAANDLSAINIRPGVSILSVLRHLNYRPWYALAEFVDNALQSFFSHRQEIIQSDGSGNALRVDIQLDPSEGGRIVIRDNAAGIYESEYARAFHPAEVPPDQSGLCEFGMGMKSAACWFAKQWSVRTSALGEPIERTILLDINTIVREGTEEIVIRSTPSREKNHYTEIVLLGLHHIPQGRTVTKIREHLASIYRVFLRDGTLDLTFNGELLQYEEPEILTAQYYRNTGQGPLVWRKDIDFDFGMGQRASGFAALRARASTSTAGFALFRRNRLIQGSGDETYRPESIFGKTNSYRYQRLFGELHLEGFEISHTKDGFRWDESEDVFLELLKEHLGAQPLNLLDQAEGFRIRPPRPDLTQGTETAMNNTASVIEREVPPVLEHQISMPPDIGEPPHYLPSVEPRPVTREIDVELCGQPWRIVVETVIDPAVGEWISISDHPDFEEPITRRRVRRVGVQMSVAHPFMERFCGTDASNIEALLRIAAGLGLAYTTARDVGATLINTIIRNLNELLRNALSKP